MRSVGYLLVALVCFFFNAGSASAAGNGQAIKELYGRFYNAQNARNLDETGAQMIESPDFLWVSDGKSIWGRKAALERMKGFQEAEVWRVEPDLNGAKVVDVSEAAAYLHLTLDLIIGAAANPDRIKFLVSALCVKNGPDWKIAALFTTTAKP